MTDLLGQLYRLQTRIRFVHDREKRRDTVPPDLVEVDREYQDKVQAVAALKSRLTEAELEKRKAEGELADHKEKLKKYQAQLRNVQSSREYSAALNEIDGVEKLDPLDRGPVPRARGRDREGARRPRRAREDPARRDRAARGDG